MSLDGDLGVPTIITQDIGGLFQPGAKVKLTVDGIDDFLAYSALRHWEAGAHLLLDPLSEPPPDAAFKAGRLWIIRFAMKEAAGEATVRLLGREADGAVRLSFPTAVLRRPLRAHVRMATAITARYQRCADDGTAMGPVLDTRLADLSMGGCAMVVREPIPVDARLRVLLTSSPNERPREVSGSVRRCVPEPDGSVRIGVQFDPLSPDARPVLVRLLGNNVFLSDTLS